MKKGDLSKFIEDALRGVIAQTQEKIIF